MKLYKAMPVIYTDSLPKHVGGRQCFGFFSKIRPKYKDDIGLHEHEYTHFKQTWRLLWLPHIVLTIFSKKYRMHIESEAFAEQLKHSDNKVRDLNWFSQMLATRYGIGCTIEEARKAIESHA